MAQARQLVARHHASHVQVQPAQMVLALHEQPDVSNPQLAQQVGCTVRTVQKWRKRWKQKGFVLDDAPRSGRPPDFSPSATHTDQSHRL